MFSKISSFIKSHKAITAGIFLLMIGGGYIFYISFFKKNASETRYVFASVEKGTIASSVSGSGQVSVSHQIALNAKISGDITYTGVAQGQEIKSGTIIARVNPRDALKAVRDAQANLQSAELSLEKLKKPADALSVLEAENSFAQANESKNNAEEELKKSYEDGFNTVANIFLDLPTIMTELHDTIFGNSLSGGGQWNIDYYADSVKTYNSGVLEYKASAGKNYETARISYDKNFDNYKRTSRFSEREAIESLIQETYETEKNISEAIKSMINLIQFYKDAYTSQNLRTHALSDTYLAALNGHTGKTNSHLSNLLGVKNTIRTNKETIVNSERTIRERAEFLANLKAGADPLDIQSQELAVKQRRNILFDAQEKLSDYTLRAPFDSLVAAMLVKRGDSVSANTSIATLITRQPLAEITLNEVDIAKIQKEQKTILTFDAVPDITISGKISEIDTLGATSQGVVSYNVKITFDTGDSRIKPGMTVSANIITNVKSDVLVVPNSAVKTQNNSYFVEIPVNQDTLSVNNQAGSGGITLNSLPLRQPVEIGITNDEYTEIVDGLKEGDQIIVNTVNPQAASRSAQPSSSFRIPGLPGSGGAGGRNAFR